MTSAVLSKTGSYTISNQQAMEALARIQSRDPDRQLPDELVLLILEHLLVDHSPPVIIPFSFTHNARMLDPCSRMLYHAFSGGVLDPKLLAMAREAYFTVNTINITSPIQLAPMHILGTSPFRQRWSREIRSLELGLMYSARATGAWWYTEHSDDMIRTNDLSLPVQNVQDIVGIVRGLPRVLPKLRRLTLSLTIRPPWHGNGVTMGTPWVTVGGSLCALLPGKESERAPEWLREVVAALRSLDIAFMALRWRTTCGHQECEGLCELVTEQLGAVKVRSGDGFRTAVLKDRRMPPWA